VLGALDGGHAVCYASGQAAAHAALLHLRPRRVIVPLIGYHGIRALLERLAENGGLELVWGDAEPAAGDVVWIETPRNATCEVADIAAHAAHARAAGARLVVDGTFASPVLQRPLDLGAHVVMHSSTKFLSGHSDALGGGWSCPAAQAEALHEERTITGAVMGALGPG
jgi:cystathionine gamma-synthase